MQSWLMPVAGDVWDTALATLLPNALKTLRSCHSGPSEPTETVAYMLWADTTAGLLKLRNAANSAWIVLGPLGDQWFQRVPVGEALSVSASRSIYLPPSRVDVTVKKIVLVTDTVTSSSSGNEWQYELENLTQTLDLFSTTVGTFSAGDVGGGETAVATPYELVPDQNVELNAGDVLELRLVAVGTVTTFGRISAFLDVEAR